MYTDLEKMDLETVTLIFLLVVFLTAEIYRARRSSRGIIVGFDDSDLGLLVSPVLTARVRLEDGSIIQADVNSCTACMGRLTVGTQVRIFNSSNGYMVDTPWFQQKSGKACGPARV